MSAVAEQCISIHARARPTAASVIPRLEALLPPSSNCVAAVDAAKSGTNNGNHHCFGQLNKQQCRLLTITTAVVSVIAVAAVTLIMLFPMVQPQKTAVDLWSPAIAQSMIDSCGITINSMTVTHWAADSFSMTAVGIIDNRAPLGGSMMPATLDLLYDGVQFGTVGFPEQSLEASAEAVLTLGSLDSPVVAAVSDPETFTKFAAALLNNPTASMTFKGSVDLKAGGLPTYTVDLEKTVTLTGAALETSVKNASIAETGANSVTMDLHACITNNGNTAFTDNGQLAVNMIYEGVVLGEAHTVDTHTVMAVGENCYDLVATMTRTPINTAKLSKLLSLFASGEGKQVRAQL